MAENGSNKPQANIGVEVPIEWSMPESMVSRYATNLVVQNGEHEFTLNFYEVRVPIILGSPDEQIEQLSKIDSVRADCVARIIIAADRLEEFISVLQGNLEKHRAMDPKEKE